MKPKYEIGQEVYIVCDNGAVEHRRVYSRGSLTGKEYMLIQDCYNVAGSMMSLLHHAEWLHETQIYATRLEALEACLHDVVGQLHKVLLNASNIKKQMDTLNAHITREKEIAK